MTDFRFQMTEVEDDDRNDGVGFQMTEVKEDRRQIFLNKFFV